jgi:hypothetical protein
MRTGSMQGFFDYSDFSANNGERSGLRARAPHVGNLFGATEMALGMCPL